MIEYTSKFTDLETWFSLYEDKHGNLMYNLNETIILLSDPSNMEIFIPEHRMFWTTISYKLYETTRLAWMLMKINKVTASSIFLPVEAATSIIYPNKEQVENILASMS